jgi:hypothetical protein
MSTKVKQAVAPKIDKGVPLHKVNLGSTGVAFFHPPFDDMAHGDSFWVGREVLPQAIVARFNSWRDKHPGRKFFVVATRRDGDGTRAWLVDSRANDLYALAATKVPRNGKVNVRASA